MQSPSRLRIFPVTVFLLTCCSLPSDAGSGLFPSRASSATGRSEEASTAPTNITIAGPLRSFLRMAAISQKASAEEVLPLLARKVAMEGYDRRGKPGRPTEYLVLLKRYVEQSRELAALAGREGMIRVSSCAEAQPLLTVLGYRLEPSCGPSASVETAEPERAFVTIDSGFPLTDLEETLQGGKPFVHPFPASSVPVLFSQNDWTVNAKGKKATGDLLDCLLRDPDLSRLYWAMAQMDVDTGEFLRRSIGLDKLLPLASVLDFYGSQIRIRSERVIVPGGGPAEPAWKNLVGASPDSPGEFVMRLLTKDGGWLVAFFDALSRGSQAQQAYLTEPRRLKLFYGALRGRDVSPGPATAVFRPNPALVLLVSRLQLDPSGQPHVPGDLDAWKEILSRKWDSKMVREFARRYSRCDSPDQLLEGMFAFSRVYSDAGPLQIYLSVSEIDRGRSPDQRLSPQTARLLAEKFARFSNQYPVFSEFRALNNTSISAFLSAAEAINRAPNRTLRADALGLFQANVGLWQILARQAQIPGANWNDSWQRVIHPFAAIASAPQLFDAARNSLGEIFRAAGARPRLSQDEIIALLAGPEQPSPESQRVRRELADRMRSALEAQRLVSLDTIFAFADGLNQMAQGKAMGATLVQLAGEFREFQMPKPLFTSSERVEWTPGRNRSSHIQQELTTDLAANIKSSRSPTELPMVRGRLVPFLRDSLVGLNYAYYAPPAAQMLFNNPLFVRTHDFTGEEVIMGGEPGWKTPSLFGRGWTASGGAHLTGSLADLPYVLAQVEQDFIVPENVQSLIWEDMVPSLLISAVLPRWWRVTRNELHAVALYQLFGEEVLGAAANDEPLEQKVMAILADRIPARRLEQVGDDLRSGRREEALSRLTPAEYFYLAAEVRRRYPDQTANWGKAGQELEKLAQQDPEAVRSERLSEDFGVPHPALAQTYACELLDVKPLPTFLGYSSRLMAESWESNNLYWARLADEKDYAPAMLNRLIPELTHRMIEKIFATDLEDWPALLRALRETGEEFRLGKIAAVTKGGAALGL
jgi:hypothetical protein